MHLIAKVMRISCSKFHCNRLTTVQDIQDYASLIQCSSVCVCMCVCVCGLVGGSEYHKQSLLARYGGDILRPLDVRKV